MSKNKQEMAILRVHPFPTLLAQAIQLADIASAAAPGAVQVLAKSAVVFAAMSLECAATSCLELTRIPKEPHAKIDRTLGVVDKFDVLQWFAVRAPLERGHRIVQKISDLVSARNALVHPRVSKQSFGEPRRYAKGDGVQIESDKSVWNALRIPKDEKLWGAEHAKNALSSVVEFLDYFFFEACKLEEKKVAQMLCTSSGEAIFLTQWESEVLSMGAEKFGLRLRFLGR